MRSPRTTTASRDVTSLALLAAATLLALASFWTRPPMLPEGITWSRYTMDIGKALREAE